MRSAFTAGQAAQKSSARAGYRGTSLHCRTGSSENTNSAARRARKLHRRLLHDIHGELATWPLQPGISLCTRRSSAGSSTDATVMRKSSAPVRRSPSRLSATSSSSAIAGSRSRLTRPQLVLTRPSVPRGHCSSRPLAQKILLWCGEPAQCFVDKLAKSGLAATCEGARFSDRSRLVEAMFAMASTQKPPTPPAEYPLHRKTQPPQRAGRPQPAASAPVVGVDLHVVVAEVAGPAGGAGGAAAEGYAEGDFRRGHGGGALLFQVVGVAAAVF